MTSSLPAGAVDLPPLVAALEGARAIGALPREACGIAHDSRAVRAGSVFVALRGLRADGHAFLREAVAAGATTVVVDERHAAGHAPVEGAATLVVPDTRRALSRLCAAFSGHPSEHVRVVGVTGTNGKTTVTHLLAALLEEAGIAAGRIGTLGAKYGGKFWSLDNTTPLALEVQSLLAAMREGGAEAVAMEVSSHALALDRVADVRFALAVLTNVTRDHLDFHETFERYAAAKRSLFEVAERAVLGVDDGCGRRWAAELAAQGRAPLTYGFASDAALRATDVVTSADGSAFTAGNRRFELRLPGRFNVANALAALAAARTFGVDDVVAARALAAFAGVPGRMEHFAGAGVDVLVDYAHTPDALETVLRAARETARGRLAVVFGCGGERDRGKRPHMGRIACEFADGVVITSDNPRGEDAATIAREIAAGIPAAATATVELDRRRAIRAAIGSARAGDVVVIAGKGHETYQILGERVVFFDDRAEVRAALAARESLPA